jgi:hypothetical protein
MRTAKGKLVRADFKLVEAAADMRALRWDQQVEGTPFARLLKSAETEVWLTPLAGATALDGEGLPPLPASPASGEENEERATETAAATRVTIELRQTLNGFVPRLGGYLVRRAAAATLEEALNGLERISG